MNIVRKTQAGVNVVGLIIFMFLGTIIMGGVVHLFSVTSQTTATSAEHTQQQASILDALNRTSRDVTVSNPLVYVSENDLVLDVTLEDGTVERRRYFLNVEDNKVWEQSKGVKRGDAYDVSPEAIKNYWKKDVYRSVAIVHNVDSTVDAPFINAFDRNAQELNGVLSGSATEAVARVDISVTAKVADKGNVSISTSAVPRSFSGLSGDAKPVLSPCPAFTATREGDSVVMRWEAVDGAESYELTRNGVTLQSATQKANKTLSSYSYTDKPGQSATVISYMLKVISPAGISNCLDSVKAIVITPESTQLTENLLPATTMKNNVPVSTDWKNASEKTTVELKWDKVSIATGYVIYKQNIDASGAPIGNRETVATLEEFPYVDLNNNQKAPNKLTYKIETDWDANIEWSILILSRTGENSNTPELRTLSYPAPVTALSVSPKDVHEGSATRVPVEDLKAGNGHTVLAWDYTAGHDARGFDIYRSAVDTQSNYTLIGSVEKGVRTFTDTKAALGSTHSYYVVAKNRSGFANHFASAIKEQLQYPADPALVAIGENGSRDLDGTNRLKWNDSKSATGYMVLTGSTCLTDCTTGIKGNEFIDSRSEVAPATRLSYTVYAVNATGSSPKLTEALTLTQRPAAPSLNKTAEPTLTTNNTSVAWSHTAGAWCIEGQYKVSSLGCTYEAKQYDLAGNVRAKGIGFTTKYNWTNQSFGRHYSYTVRAQNGAVTNGGWSNESAKVEADTYPGHVVVDNRNGDINGNHAQRVVYSSSKGNGGWGDVNLGGHSTAVWSNVEGARSLELVRVHDGHQATSNDPSLLLPKDNLIGASVKGNDWGVTGSHWTALAAPGTSYRYDVTVTSIENNLQRRVSSNTTSTPADVPMQGAVRVVCAGPGNGDSTGQRNHPAQVITNRLDYSNVASRYGYYEKTAVAKFYTPSRGAGLHFNGWHDVPKGGSVNGLDASHGVGYFYGIESGFSLTNTAVGRTSSATLGIFTNSTILTFDGCAPSGQPMQEPYDACYVATYAGCMALNPEQRPKWLSR